MASTPGQDIINSTINWQVNKPGIVEIYEDGLIKAIKPGECIITGVTADGHKKDTVTVYVISAYDSVNIEQGENISIALGETVNLTLVRRPGYEVVENAKWNPVSQAFVQVSESGQVTGKMVGATTVYAYDSVSGYKDAIRVQVNSRISGIQLDKTNLVLTEENPEYQFTANLLSRYSDKPIVDKTVSWKTSDSRVATVDEKGLVKAVSNGVVRITATTKDSGYEDVASVEVKLSEAVSSRLNLKNMDFNKMPYGISVGEAYKLDFINVPEGLDLSKLKAFVQYGPSDQVEYRDDGIYFTSMEKGKNKLQIIDDYGNRIEWEFRSSSNLGRVEVDEESMPPLKEGRPGLYIGQTYKVEHILFPLHGRTLEDIAIKDVIWSSSDKDVATVEGNMVTAHKLGEFTLTVKTVDSGRTDSIDMRVVPMVTRISLPEEILLKVDDSQLVEPDFDVSGGGVYTEPFEDGYELKVIQELISLDVLKVERDYEEKVLQELETIENVTNTTRSEIARHQVRLKLINDMLRYSGSGYATVKSGYKNRDGSPFTALVIEGKNLIGKQKGKAIVQVKSVDNDKIANTTVIVE